MKEYTKLCIICNEPQLYTSKWGLTCAIKNNTPCKTCKSSLRKLNAGYYDEQGKIYKICPECDIEKMIFNSYEAYKYSFEHNSKCKKCKAIERELKLSFIYKRQCPKCNVELVTKNKYWNEIAIKESRICPACAGQLAAARIVTEETKKKMRDNHADVSGQNNPFYGKRHPDEIIEQIRKQNIGRKRSLEVRLNTSKRIKGKGNPFYGKKHTIASRRKIRLKYVEREILGNGYVPSVGCNESDYFRLLEENKKWDGIYVKKHKKQYFIKELGYWPDYYEPTLNIIVEYDEPHHYEVDGTLKSKDTDRMEEIIKYLHCRFFRYNERTKELKEYHINEKDTKNRTN